MKSNIVYFQDLRNVGVSTTEIRGALDCCLKRLSRGVYSVIRRCDVRAHRRFSAFATDVPWLEQHAAGLSSEPAHARRYEEHLKHLRIVHYPHFRPDDIICGVSAARLHRIGMFNEPDTSVSVFHPAASTRTSELVRRRRLIAEEDICTVEGLRVTTPARTVLDLRSELGNAAGFAAMEQVLRRHMLGDDEDRIFKLGYPPHLLDDVPQAQIDLFLSPIRRLAKGKMIASRLARLASPLSESYAESQAAFNLHLLGLHDFAQQVDIIDRGRRLTRLDFLFREDRIALYVDGTQKYVDGGFDVMSKESRQHNRLLAMGYKVVRFNFSEVHSPKLFSEKLFHQAPELRSRCRNRLIL